MRIQGVYWLLPYLFCLSLPAVAPARETQKETRSSTAAVVQTQTDVAPSISGDWRPVVQGRLKNGVRYAILPRQGREPGVGMLLRVEGGFIAERRPGERGLAHLIEHIAFHSPTQTSPDELDRFPRVGVPLTFPAPSAGTTSWRETNYFVSSRRTKSADLDTLLMLFRELAGELTFRADATDGSRTEVVREMAERKPGNDLYANYVAAVAPGSPTDIIDAQNSDDVPTASIETIRALYHRLYRPENTMVVIVGNVDAGQLKTLIERRFETWQGVGPRSKTSSMPVFQSSRIAPISYSTAKGRTGVTISVTMPSPPPLRKRETQARSMLMDLVAVAAVNAQLRHTQPDAPPGKIGITIETADGFRMIRLLDHVTPGQWQPAIAGLKKTTCNLNAVGFSEPEWAAAKQTVFQDLEQRVNDMAGVLNVELAKDLSHAIADGKNLIAPDELLRYARTWLPTIDAQAGSDWWRRQWHAGVEHIRVESPDLAQIEDARKTIKAAVNEAVQDTGCKVRSS